MPRLSKNDEKTLLDSLPNLDLKHDMVLRTKVYKQFQPLVYKIVQQWSEKTPLGWDDLVGWCNLAFVESMNNWDASKGQNFKQYVAYQMVYKIMNMSCETGHTVKFSSYFQEKARESGESTFIIKSIDSFLGKDGDDFNIDSLTALGVDVQPEIEETVDDNVVEHLYKLIEANQSPRNADIFFRSYGVNGRKLTKGKDIAQMYNISVASVSLIKKAVEDWCASDKNPLKDKLFTAFQQMTN